MDAIATFRRYFGHDSFRPGQQEAIDALLAGGDLLSIMPTGSGKSVCYQVPALMLQGVTLVVSPLISLMKDQVMGLIQAGVPAAYINSSLTPGQISTALRRAAAGQYKIIYIAPERLTTPGMAQLCERIDISLVAVDEAHCVSQWGQDFRPSYLDIAGFVNSLPHRPPVGAFTATATARVQADIVNLLDLRSPHRVVTGYDRPNLYYDIAKPSDKMGYTLDYVARHRDQSGIIYCATRKAVEQVCERLRNEGVNATRYHAGLEDDERRANQEAFAYDQCPVMVATNAFGMGIDKSNVSYVLHYNMPKDLESYYQEAGRAGRDGSRAECVLLYDKSDVETARYLINVKDSEALTPAELDALREADLVRLDHMINYCRWEGCLRAYILDYFGESHGAACGACGHCVGDFVRLDVTAAARAILRAVQLSERRWRSGLGAGTILGALMGERSKALRDRGMDKLPFYGELQSMSKTQLNEVLDHLLSAGLLAREGAKYPVLRLTDQGYGLLSSGEGVYMRVRREAAPLSVRAAGKAKAAGAPYDQALFDQLRDTRTALAKKAKVPAYLVLSNAALADLAAKRPHSNEELLKVSGFGEFKVKLYGEAFLSAIAAYEQEHRAVTLL